MPPSCEERNSFDWEMGGQFKRQEPWEELGRSRNIPKPKLFTLKFRHLAIFTLRLVSVTLLSSNTEKFPTLCKLSL